MWYSVAIVSWSPLLTRKWQEHTLTHSSMLLFAIFCPMAYEQLSSTPQYHGNMRVGKDVVQDREFESWLIHLPLRNRCQQFAIHGGWWINFV